nr:S8 family serine peptidase [Actinoplanes lichenis]
MRVRPGVLTGAALALAITLTGLPVQAAQAADKTPAVSSEVLAKLADDGTTSFWVYLRERADLSAAAKIADDGDRTTRVYEQLTDTAADSQKGLRSLLDSRKAKYSTYWIANAVRVTGDRALLDAIAARSDVERIDPVRTWKVPEPVAKHGAAKAGTAAVEWNITDIGATRVWDEFADKGEGIVVANVDTGVDITHPAVKSHYRGLQADGSVNNNYNFFDPANVCGGTGPCDNHGHGTHTIGTMVGDDGGDNKIGVAPGAKFIAAKGCESGSCSDSSLLASGQWILAPTDSNGQNPRPDLRPDVVNNSWGGGRGDLWYQETVEAWAAAGIFPAFANGNTPGTAPCNSASDPGDYPVSYAVGAYGSNHVIGAFSNKGSSSIDNSVKPDISAPGVAVRSSIPGGYDSWDGTSMATPHVAGAVALIWAAAPSLRGDIAATRALLDDTAIDTNDTSCGGTADDNNIYGEGRLDVYSAVVAAPRGPVARASGTVTDAGTGQALADVTVTAAGRTVTTGADGKYQLTFEAGTYDVTATKYGYVTKTTPVTVGEGEVKTVNFALAPAPTVTVSGTVTDGSGHGWPLYAKVEVAGRPGAPLLTDPVTGRYSVALPANASYEITATPVYPGYQPTTVDVIVGTSAKTANIAAPVAPACTAAGYSVSYGESVLTESFDSTATPAGWSVVNRTDGGGWGFTDIGSRGNKTGGSGGFAIIDSDKLGSGKSQDSDLVTPALDLSGQSAPFIRFKSDFQALQSPIDIDVTVDDGANWTNVWHQTANRRGPVTEEVSLAPAAGAASAKVRFRYAGSYAWWWQVDDVQVVNRACTPIPGGLVVGTTTDALTGAALTGVKVGDALSGEGGFYWLFSPELGAHPLTAAKAPYQPLTKTVTVVANKVTRADFALSASRLTVTPTEIQSFQTYGTTRTTNVTVKNTGNATATVDVLERPRGFEALRARGTAGVTVPMKGLSPAMTGPTFAATNPKVGTKAADSWTALPNYPLAIFDNAAAVIDGKLYSVGGGSGTGNEKKAFVYADGAWTALPDLPSVRSKPVAAAVDGKLYVLGGWGTGGTPVATVDVFDPAAGSWSTLAATNPKATSAAGSAVVDGKIYLVGGCLDGDCTPSADTVVFDPAAGSFSTSTAYPNETSFLGCGAVGGKVYCAGGYDGISSTKATKVLDPAAGTWTAAADAPLDLWGGQATAAGGLLVLAGGVANDSSGVTSQVIGFDPAAGTWSTLPAMAAPRYRGAAACGFYRIGGSATPFVGTNDSALLDGLGDCAADGDVPWLSEDPASFELAPGKSKTVKVTLNATVAQPGVFTAQLGLRTNSPYAVPAVDVEMNVSPPASWGKVQGTVTGVSCSGTETPLKATVRLNGTTSYTLVADASGHFQWWLPKGTYQVIVAKDGWIPEVQSIKVSAGFVLTSDFDLDPVISCAQRERIAISKSL